MKISQELSNKIANMALVCAILVVPLHIGHPSEGSGGAHLIDLLLFNGLGAIAVPFFFVCSGFFLGRHEIEGREYLPELKKRIWSLVVPFYVWGILYCVFRYSVVVAANIVAGRSIFSNVGFSVSLARQLIGVGTWTFLIPLWYVRSLILFVLFSPLILKMSRHAAWFIALAILSIGYLVVTPEGWQEAYWKQFIRFVISPKGLLCFSFGLLLSRDYPLFARISRGGG